MFRREKAAVPPPAYDDVAGAAADEPPAGYGPSYGAVSAAQRSPTPSSSSPQLPYQQPPPPARVPYGMAPAVLLPSAAVRPPASAGAGRAGYGGGSAYQTGLLACGRDTEICAVGCICPGLVVAQTMGRQEPGDGGVSSRMLFALCPWCLACAVYGTRRRVQQHFGIDEGECARFLVSVCCAHCAACQDAREVQLRRRASPAAGAAINASAP